MGSHAKMKQKPKPQAVKELEQGALLNEVALSLAVKMMSKIYPNDAEFGKSVRKGIYEGVSLEKLHNELETLNLETESETNKNQ